MDRKNIQIAVWVMVIFIIVLFLLLGTKASGETTTISPESYYTWGISADNKVIIPDGYIPTEVSIKIKGLTQIIDSQFDTLYVHLLSRTQLGWFSHIDDQTGDIFDYLSWVHIKFPGTGPTTPSTEDPILLTYSDFTTGKEDVTILLRTLNNPDSWVWKVFKSPLDFRLSNGTIIPLKSTLLTFFDSVGVVGNIFGIGLDPDGMNGFTFDNITITITIETYAIAYDKKTIVIEYTTLPIPSNKSPYIY